MKTFPTFPTLDRSTLDSLIIQAHNALTARDVIESCISTEWRTAHNAASAACQAVTAERKRLWKMERWGAWMNVHDRQLATITGEL